MISMYMMSLYDLIQGESVVQNGTASYWSVFVYPIESHDFLLFCLTVIGPFRSHDSLICHYSFQLNCFHQVVLIS